MAKDSYGEGGKQGDIASFETVRELDHYRRKNLGEGQQKGVQLTTHEDNLISKDLKGWLRKFWVKGRLYPRERKLV